jgi:radical SAM superfamily enzyme YgiQ (UPF0313 family)
MSWAEIKKARARLSREQGTITKDWGGKIPIALVYPNSYYLGMSNLGMHALYRLFNNHGDFVCERAFWEPGTSGAVPVSLETQRPLSDFAVLAFSVSYELDYFNIVQLLKTSNIPLFAKDRDQRHPLIIAGGPCIIANPAPLSPLFDVLAIGEAEAIAPDLLTAIAAGIEGDRSRMVQQLATIPGIYVPQIPPEKPVIRRCSENLDQFPVGSVVLTPDTELGDLFLIEVERGCNWGCRFCLTGRAFSPMRCRSLESLVAQAAAGLKYRRRIGLVGAAVGEHPQIEELLGRLRVMGADISISSLRMAPLSGTLLDELTSGGVRTVTLAPEAGSERLRQVIKKGVSADDVRRAAEKVAELGIKQVKLYYMIGLPTETDEDIEEMIGLTLRCKDILDSHQTGNRLTLNISAFVPKAGTPFQWLPMAPTAVLDQRLALLRNRLTSHGIKIKSESPAWSQVQSVLSRGDEGVASVLAGMEGVSLSSWRKAVVKNRLDVDYYAHRQWDFKQKLPWEIRELGIRPGYLEAECRKALAQVI